MSELPEPLRTVVLMRDLQGMSHEDIGRALGLPTVTVKSRIIGDGAN